MDPFWIALFVTLTFAACASSEQVVLMQTPYCTRNSCNMCQFSGVWFLVNLVRMKQNWIAMVATLAFVPWTSAKEVKLYATPSGNWEWETNKLKPIPHVSGWNYRPSTPQEKMNWYTVCDLSDSILQEPNSWLISTKQIDVGDVRRVDVTVRYSITPCLSNPSANRFCKDYFDVFYWEFNSEVTSDKIPDPIFNNSLYRRFANISSQASGEKILTISLEIKSRYIILGFRDQGGCRILYSVKVAYNVCPGRTLIDSLVSLPETIAPSDALQTIPVEGICTANSALMQGSLNVHCESSGVWNTSLLKGRCVCKEDMENIGGKCEDCESGEYNNQRGLNCTALPSAPKNFSVTYINQSAVGLNWQPPEITGDNSHVSYDVICLKPCHSDNDRKCVEETCQSDVGFIPDKNGLNDTQVIVINLVSFVNYTFKIYARNRVSGVAKRKHQVEGNFTAITVRTLGTIPGKPKVFIKQSGVTVYVSWTLKRKNGFIKNYHVTYVRVDDSLDSKSLATKKTKQNFKDLKAGKTYEFQVFAENSFGKGPVGVKTFKVRNGGVAEKLVVPIAAGGGSMLFILLLVIVIVILVLRRRKSKRNVQRDYMRSIEHGGELGQRHYINPANYLNLMELLSTFASEIERSKTKLEGLIGQGEFADVYKGTLKTQGGRDVVAIKVLRPGSNVKNQKDFLSEASIMGQFNHPNVVRLIGVVTQSRPMMILTEFLESGSLDHFLKERDGQLMSLQLVGMARGVACGMVYLSEKNLIHRDLAARNILVGENMLCKVSDFGLSRELADDDPDSEYETHGGKIAVRWTAPEALQCRKFSSASDVWSYGILVWEIMSFCDRPYWEWTNIDVINRVEFGYRLPPPKGCPKVIHSLMMECWESDKNERPKFAEIVSRLDKIIRSPDVLMDISLAPEPREVEASNQSDVPEFESVDDWLIFLKMDSHLKLFQAANVDSLDKVAKLEDKDLREMGVKLIGHRNKMNKSIKSIKGRYVNRGMDEDEGAI